jgi:pentatricopeptide repeat protein
MKYEVFTASTLAGYIEENIINGYHEDYYSDKLASFNEIHVIQFCPDGLARLGLSHKVVLNMSWIKYLDNPYREKRIKRLLEYLERYSKTFHEAMKIYNKMIDCGIEPNAKFFQSYAEMLEFLGSKMKIT